MTTSNVLDAIKSVNGAFDEFRGTVMDRVEALEAMSDRPRGSAVTLEERKAFNGWARTGNGLDTKEMSIAGGAAAGEALVPEIIADQIISKALSQGPIANIVRRTQADSSDYVRLLNTRGQAAAWVGEAGERTQTGSMQFREIRPTHGELYAHVLVSNWLLQDSKFDVAALISENAAAQFARALETSVISGNGSSRPTGLLANTPTTAADDASPLRGADVLRYIAGTADLADDLLGMYFDLAPEYRANATFAMSSASLAAVRKLRDANGSGYLFQERLAGGVDSGDGTILGKRVITSEDLDTVGASPADFSILCGDFAQGYELVQYGGLQVIRDPYSVKGKVGFYLAARFGGRITDNDSIRVLAA